MMKVRFSLFAMSIECWEIAKNSSEKEVYTNINFDSISGTVLDVF